ncbi:MAG: hypothetical protein H6713_30445 [Myxococcales bacterium]|nr:hypothetical protein [Myxococcales bacterium]
MTRATRPRAVYLGRRRVKLDPARIVGQGGEAEVYALDGGLALKLFKQPDHPDFDGLPGQQAAAEQRLEEHQRKLPALLSETRLPAAVVAPRELATTRDGRRVLGYAMPLISGCEPLLRMADVTQRRAHGLTHARAGVDALRRLHEAVGEVHDRGWVLGDFNELNVLVGPAARPGVHLIDVDSFQLPGFPCALFTERFLDPLRCDGHEQLVPVRPPTRDSDWYAFAVMAMRCAALVGPYGGVHKPRDPKDRVPSSRRPLRRLTVFHPDVRYPRPAIPYQHLPDELLHALVQWFVEDRRGVFPRAPLDALRWTRCDACGLEHARPNCPQCTARSPAIRRETSELRGTVLATTVATTRGPIVHVEAEPDEERPRWLAREGDALRREDSRVVVRGALDPRAVVRLERAATLIGLGGQVIRFAEDGARERVAVDCVAGRPAFDARGGALYWAHGGLLYRRSALGPERVGAVLEGQTRLWVGPRFVFGFYRAGALCSGFIHPLRAGAGGLRDGVPLPPLRGRLLAADCVFTRARAWLRTTCELRGALHRSCAVIDERGQLLASVSVSAGDEAPAWLTAAGSPCSAGEQVFAPTDDGVVRLELVGGRVLETRRFPDTAAYVDAATRLLITRRGLLAVSSRAITRLELRP